MMHALTPRKADRPAPEEFSAPPGYRLLMDLGETEWGRAFILLAADGSRRSLLTELRNDRGKQAAFSLALALTNLRHPCLVGSTWAGQSPGGRARLITEMVEGTSLATLLDRGTRFEAIDALRVIRDVAEALAHLSGAGLGHGAVSPLAIVLSPGTGPRLRGFGPDRGLWPRMAEFAPPNSLPSSVIDSAADVYALGRILEAMLGRGAALRAPMRGLILDSILPNRRDPLSTPAQFASRCAGIVL